MHVRIFIVKRLRVSENIRKCMMIPSLLHNVYYRDECVRVRARVCVCVCTYRIAGFCREDFNVASHGIRNIKIRDIFYLVTFLSREIL